MLKNVTLTAEEALIEQAREAARLQHKTLNQAFREWLVSYTRPETDPVDEYEAVGKRLSYVKAGRKFTRGEMNERQELSGYECLCI